VLSSFIKALLPLAVAVLYSIWWGGLVFYSAIVVPAGSHILGASEQGLVTKNVTFWLNLLGILNLVWIGAALRWYQWFDPTIVEPFEPLRSLPPEKSLLIKWLMWWAMVLVQILLVVLHYGISSMFDGSEISVHYQDSFYSWHQVYLWLTVVQLAGGLWWLGLFVLQFGHKEGEVF